MRGILEGSEKCKRDRLVDLDHESTQDLRHEAMHRKTKASGKKGLEHDQLAFWLGDLLRPRDTRHSASEISKLLHFVHPDRGLSLIPL